MKKILTLSVITLSLLVFSACEQTEKIKDDATQSYNNLKEGVTETKENIDRSVQSVKETTEKVTGTVDKVKEATNSVSDIVQNDE